MTTTQTLHRPLAGRPDVGSPSSWPRFLAGFAVMYGVLALLGGIDPTGGLGLVLLPAVLLTAVVVARVLDRSSAARALGQLGFGRPNLRALAVAAAVSLGVLAVFPLTAALGVDADLRPGWPWLLLGVFAYHGLAEELVWRAFAYRRLRDGRSFRSAVLWTMPLIAATHLPIVVTAGPAVGIGAMVVAAVTSLPLAHLYEMGGRTLWAPALVHTAIDSFKLVVIPAAVVTSFSLTLVAVSILVPLLALLVPRAPSRTAVPGLPGRTLTGTL